MHDSGANGYCESARWKTSFESLEAHAKGGFTSCSLLVKVLTVPFDMSDFLIILEKWENLIKQHDAIVDELESVQERNKIASLSIRLVKGFVPGSRLGGSCEVHALRTTQEDQVECRPGRVSFFGETSVETAHDCTGPTPVEICMVRCQYGKKGGRGKAQHQKQICEQVKNLVMRRRIAGTPRKANLRLVLARATPVHDLRARAKARTNSTRPSRSVSGAARQAMRKDCRNARGIKIGADSGAAGSVWPRDFCEDFSTKKTEKRHEVRDCGQ